MDGRSKSFAVVLAAVGAAFLVGCHAGDAVDACHQRIESIYKARFSGDEIALRKALVTGSGNDPEIERLFDRIVARDKEVGPPRSHRSIAENAGLKTPGGGVPEWYSVSELYEVQLRDGKCTERFVCRTNEDGGGAIVEQFECTADGSIRDHDR